MDNKQILNMNITTEETEKINKIRNAIKGDN